MPAATKMMMVMLLAPAAAFHSAPRVQPSLRPLRSAVAETSKVPPIDKKIVSEILSKVVKAPVASEKPAASGDITYDEVRGALKAWTEGIIDIGKVFTDGGDYKAKAMEVIESNYAFSHDLGAGNQILFKPTKAAEHPFRSNYDEFVSYFVGDGKYSEDGGFAITPWSSVRFDMYGVFIMGQTATVSGNYWFTNANDDSETKVEYTFQFVRVEKPAGKLKIVLHHSSIPFSP